MKRQPGPAKLDDSFKYAVTFLIPGCNSRRDFGEQNFQGKASGIGLALRRWANVTKASRWRACCPDGRQRD